MTAGSRIGPPPAAILLGAAGATVASEQNSIRSAMLPDGAAALQRDYFSGSTRNAGRKAMAPRQVAGPYRAATHAVHAASAALAAARAFSS